MSPHSPKTAALIAYAEGVLSAAGRARLERHLAGCEVCRRELAAIEVYDRMVEEAREAPVPAVDFDRMELALAREAKRVSVEIGVAQRRRWVPVALFAAAAAALLALWTVWPKVEAPEAPVAERPEPPAPTPEPAPEEAPRLEPTVTLAAGRVHRIDADRDTGRIDTDSPSLVPGEVLVEGARIRTDEASALHLRLRTGTGLIAQAETTFALEAAREDAVRVALEEGTVAQHVAPLESGSTYVVLAGGYEVAVRGTAFAVSYVDGVVGVELAEGVVAVQPPEGEAFELTAPARWRSEGEAAGEEPPTVERPRGLDGAEGTLVTLADPRIVRWEVDGTTVAASELRLRLAEGEHRVRGWDLRDRLFVALVPVGSASYVLEADALRPEGPRISPGHLDPEEIAPVVQRGRRQLRSCYEASLRRGSEIAGRVRLRVTLDVMGGVSRVQVPDLEGRGADALRSCVTNYVSRWTFPPPGGPMTFEVPLNLTAR